MISSNQLVNVKDGKNTFFAKSCNFLNTSPSTHLEFSSTQIFDFQLLADFKHQESQINNLKSFISKKSNKFTLDKFSFKDIYSGDWTFPDGLTYLTVFDLGEILALNCLRLGQFLIFKDGSFVLAYKDNDCSFEEFEQSFSGLIRAIVLELKGACCLHASSVYKDSSCLGISSENKEAIAFVGPSGAGKSTTAFRALSKGWSLLNDDISPFLISDQDEVSVIPGKQELKICPDIIGNVVEVSDDKLRNQLYGKHLIDVSSSDSESSSKISLSKLVILEKEKSPELPLVFNLMSNFYISGRLRDFLGLTKQHFNFASKIAKLIEENKLEKEQCLAQQITFH